MSTTRPKVDQETTAMRVLSWVATITSMLMYVSYLAQIRLNLAGHHGSVIQPLAATVNCTLWVVYAVGRRKRDWPVALANAPGIALGAIAFLTAID